MSDVIDERDERVAASLRDYLERRGLTVFVDKQISGGADWGKWIESHIRKADVFLVLLSAEAVDSDMVKQEVRLACQASKPHGKPRVIPIRVQFDGDLEYELAAHLQGRQHLFWNNDESLEEVGQGIIQAVTAHEELTEEAAAAGAPRVPPVRESPRLPARYGPTVGSLLPYLVDRTKQVRRVVALVDQSRQRNSPCPVVCFVPGDEFQCHDKFTERLRDVTLPPRLGLTAGQSLADGYFSLPREFEGSEAYQADLWFSLQEALRQPSREQVHQAIVAQPFVLQTQICTATWNRQGPVKSQALLQFWNRYTFPLRVPLVVCVRVKYYRGSLWERWQFRWRNRQMASFLQSLDWTGYAGLVGDVLEPLSNLRREDVEDWVEQDAKSYVDARRVLGYVRELFLRRTDMHMEELAKELLAVL